MRSLLHKSNSTLKKCFPTLKSSCLWLSRIRSTANLLFSIFLWYFSCPLLSYHSHHSLHHSAAHTFLTAHWFSHSQPHMGVQRTDNKFAHLTERCRISVRDLLMLLAILTSSFSSESVYWASWSRLRAQSARLVSSSACTVYGKTRPRGQPLARVKGCRQPHGPNSCVSFTPPKALAPIWHTIFPCQPAHWRTNRGLTCTGTALFR